MRELQEYVQVLREGQRFTGQMVSACRLGPEAKGMGRVGTTGQGMDTHKVAQGQESGLGAKEVPEAREQGKGSLGTCKGREVRGRVIEARESRVRAGQPGGGTG